MNKILEANQEKRTKCSVWSRVMGYFRPRSQYNKGKAQEAKDRKAFNAGKYCSCVK